MPDLRSRKDDGMTLEQARAAVESLLVCTDDLPCDACQASLDALIAAVREDAIAAVQDKAGPLIDDLDEWRPGKQGSDGELIAIIHLLREALEGQSHE